MTGTVNDRQGVGDPAVIADPAAIEALVPEWRELVIRSGSSVFSSPDWLVSWRRWYATSFDAFVLAWRDGRELRGIAPLVRMSRRLPPVRELGLWGGSGTALRGLVDIVALPADRLDISRSLARWLAGPAAGWDTLSLLRLPPGSATGPAIRSLATGEGWHLVSQAGVVRSESYMLDLAPRGAPLGAPGHPPADVLGPKARHNIRTETRRFERQGGRYETVTAVEGVAEIVAALRRLSIDRWGPAERTFQADPVAEAFFRDALEAMARQGCLVAHVARDAAGIRAGLVTLVVGRRAVALLVGVSTGDDVRRLSLGKHLFAASIETAAGRGAETYDFLWQGGYKEQFWGATPHQLESLLVGRGLLGGLVARRAATRRAPTPPAPAGTTTDGAPG